MGNATYFLDQSQYDFLAQLLPQPPRRPGRPAIPNNELLNGILFVVKTGCRWMDIPVSLCTHDYTSCWRRLRFWQRHGYLKLSWQHILVLLDREGQVDLSIGNVDGSLVQSPQYAGVGYDSQHHRPFASYATVTSGSVVCFRRLWTWPAYLSVCGGWEFCNEFSSKALLNI